MSYLSEEDVKRIRERRIKRPRNSSTPAAKFELAWAIIQGPPLTVELRFHDTRMWRFDYAHEASRVAIEINGGVHKQGRHNRGLGSVINARGERVRRGYLGDLEKINAATALGWRVFQLGGDMVDDMEQLEAISKAIAGAAAEGVAVER